MEGREGRRGECEGGVAVGWSEGRRGEYEGGVAVGWSEGRRGECEGGAAVGWSEGSICKQSLRLVPGCQRWEERDHRERVGRRGGRWCWRGR